MHNPGEYYPVIDVLILALLMLTPFVFAGIERAHKHFKNRHYRPRGATKIRHY
jgi:hypothetical protein